MGDSRSAPSGPRRARAALAGALLALAPGCLTVHYSEGNAIRAERIGQIQPGVTRKSEILEWFGAPQTLNEPDMLRRLLQDQSYTPSEVVTLPFQDVMAYQFSEGQVKGLLFFVYNEFDVQIASDRLVIFFDANDVVLYYGYRKGTDALQIDKNGKQGS